MRKNGNATRCQYAGIISFVNQRDAPLRTWQDEGKGGEGIYAKKGAKINGCHLR